MKIVGLRNRMGFPRRPLSIATALYDYLLRATQLHVVVWADDEFIAVLARDSTLLANLCRRSYVMGTYNNQVRLAWLVADVTEALKA